MSDSPAPVSRLRVGQGLDAHRLAAGRALILGGVELDHPLGLLGHSDADVLTHAVCDALLGAAGLGDLGRHFPDTDPRYKDISSLEILAQVGDMIREKGFVPVNLDATLVAEAPKIAPFREKMEENLAKALGISPGRVNVSATTTEGLGMAGKGEGMAAMCVAMIEGREELSSTDNSSGS